MSFPYFDWGMAWHKCGDCGGKYQQKHERAHFKFECGKNSPVADKIAISTLAAQLNVHRVTIWRWVRKYGLKTTNYCGAAYISKKEYERFLREDGKLVVARLAEQMAKVVDAKAST